MDLAVSIWQDYQKKVLSRHEVIAYFEQVLVYQPNQIKLLHILALLYKEQEQYTKSLEYIYQSFELVPGDFGSIEIAVECLWKLNEHLKAYQLLRTALEHNPESANLHYQMAFFYFYRLGRVDSAFPLLEKAIAIEPHQRAYLDTMLFMAYAVWELSPEKRFRYYQRWGQLVEDAERCVSESWSNLPDPDKKIKVGYVGGDFRRHSAIHDYRILFDCYDRQQFDYYIYDTSPIHDDMGQWFYERVTQSHDVSGMSTDTLVKLIQREQIDILVDLSSHSEFNRLDVFARKPAPIQMTGRGFGSTSGLTRIDYRFTDSATTPPELEPFNSEQLVFLPSRMFWYVDSLMPKLMIKPPPVFINRFITFGYSNAPFKLNAFLIETWCAILNQVPHSRIQLKYYELDYEIIKNYYIELFHYHGIHHERVTFLGGTDTIEHYQFYNQVDIVLDPFPFNGGVSTMDALWMGRPVVVLADGTRSGACILSALGDTRLLASTPDEYIRIAVELAQNREHIQDINQNMRQRMLDSHLCNGLEMVQATEAIYKDVWRKWCLQKTEGHTVLQLAQEALNHRNWRDAKKLFCSLLAQNPKHAQALHGLGLVTFECGQSESAIRLLNEALLVMPTNPYIYLHLAMIHTQLKQSQQALYYLQQALHLNPELEAANTLWGELGEQFALELNKDRRLGGQS